MVAASGMTATILPPEALRHLRPECIPPVVGFLVHPSNTTITGSIFEIGGGHVSQIRFERARGALLKPDSTLTPGAILQKWDKVNDFSAPTHPTEPPDFMQLLKEAQNLDKSDQGKASVNLTGKVAVITGAGAG
jgi:multifunctional beta-oxidation protein